MFRRVNAGKKSANKPEYEKHRIGNSAEQLAFKFLVQNGLKLIQTNYTTRLGEIDLIMRDKEVVVFVEVRFRSHPQYGDGAESITYYKRQKIIKTALCFIQAHPHVNECPCRFDVVSVSNDGTTTHCNWIKDAFQVD